MPDVSVDSGGVDPAHTPCCAHPAEISWYPCGLHLQISLAQSLSRQYEPEFNDKVSNGIHTKALTSAKLELSTS